jgi:hypothetical protein
MYGRPIGDYFWLECELDPDTPLQKGEYVEHRAVVTTTTRPSRYEPLADVRVWWEGDDVRTPGRGHESFLAAANNEWRREWGRRSVPVRRLVHTTSLYRPRGVESAAQAVAITTGVSICGGAEVTQVVQVVLG